MYRPVAIAWQTFVPSNRGLHIAVYRAHDHRRVIAGNSMDDLGERAALGNDTQCPNR